MKYFGDTVTRVPFKRFGRHYFILKGDTVTLNVEKLFYPIKETRFIRVSYIVPIEDAANCVSYWLISETQIWRRK